MKAHDVMNMRVTAARPMASGRDLAFQLLSGKYSGVPVIDSKCKIIGIVTELDLLRAIRNGKDLQRLKAEDIMSKPVICAAEDEDVYTVIDKMSEQNIIRLPVVRDDGKLIGLISRADILCNLIEPVIDYFQRPAFVTVGS